jgi:hypothetical protein
MTQAVAAEIKGAVVICCPLVVVETPAAGQPAHPIRLLHRPQRQQRPRPKMSFAQSVLSFFAPYKRNGHMTVKPDTIAQSRNTDYMLKMSAWFQGSLKCNHFAFLNTQLVTI